MRLQKYWQQQMLPLSLLVDPLMALIKIPDQPGSQVVAVTKFSEHLTSDLEVTDSGISPLVMQHATS